jgi:DNA-binding transcriptional ArsR family regulator
MPRATPEEPAPGHPAASAGQPDEDLFEEAAETFAMLGSPVRLQLLWLLARSARDVGSLAEAIGASKALTSQHLAKLRAAGLVSAERKGKRQVYLLDDPHIVTLVHQGIDHHQDLRDRGLG